MTASLEDVVVERINSVASHTGAFLECPCVVPTLDDFPVLVTLIERQTDAKRGLYGILTRRETKQDVATVAQLWRGHDVV